MLPPARDDKKPPATAAALKSAKAAWSSGNYWRKNSAAQTPMPKPAMKRNAAATKSHSTGVRHDSTHRRQQRLSSSRYRCR